MRVSMLKIDRSFVGGLEDESGTAVLTASIVQLARNLGWSRSPRASRPRSSGSFSSRTAATSARASTSAARCRPTEIQALYRASREDDVSETAA